MIRVVCVGKLKEAWQKAACEEYVKRLSRYGGVEIVEIADKPEGDDARRAVLLEGETILSRLRADEYVIALCVRADAPDSEGFAARLERLQARGARVAFVIGGSNGLSDAVLARANERVSFSHLTFPHALARVILLEQLYRSAKINAGEKYHK